MNFYYFTVPQKVIFFFLYQQRALNALPLNHNCDNDDEYLWHKDDFVVNFAGCEEVKKDCKERFNEILSRTRLSR